MKKTISILSIFIVAILLFQGCKKTDDGTVTFGIYQPIYKTMAEVRSSLKSSAPTSLGQVGKIYVKDNLLLINEPDKGIHIFDNTIPSTPQNLTFISIPGCQDMSVLGNILYADCYTDLFAIDISDPTNAVLKSFQSNIFPDRKYYSYSLADSGKILAGYQKIKDTTINKTDYFFKGIYANGLYYDAPKSSSNNSFLGVAFTAQSNTTTGIAGSTSRFAIQNNTLYTVSNYNLSVLNLSNSQQPNLVKTINLGWGIETIYPFQDRLFIGSNIGMKIYDVTNPSNPVFESNFSHVRSCDPVIADGHYAYVTLHSESWCGGNINELDVLDISNLSNPILIKTLPLTSPRGLAKMGNQLLICDGKNGLKIFDATHPNNPNLVQKIALPETADIILTNGKSIVTTTDGVYQYKLDASGISNYLSKIGL